MKAISFLFICILWSCQAKEVSEKEVIHLTAQDLDSIIAGHDSLTIESPSGKLYDTVKTYYWKDQSTSKRFLLDSLGRIRSHITLKEGKYLKSAHFYTNGQLKGRLSYSDSGILNGPGTYFYEDGRIKSQGRFKDNHPIGEWKYYDPSGNLERVLFYDENGDAIDSLSN